MDKDAKIIIERIKVLFKRIPNTEYTISVVNDIYDKQYNFFFEIQKRNENHKNRLENGKNVGLKMLICCKR